MERQGNANHGPLFSMPVLSGSLRRLADIEGQSGAWSPDGKKLAYTKWNTLYVANADGTDPHKVLELKILISSVLRYGHPTDCGCASRSKRESTGPSEDTGRCRWMAPDCISYFRVGPSPQTASAAAAGLPTEVLRVPRSRSSLGSTAREPMVWYAAKTNPIDL